MDGTVLLADDDRTIRTVLTQALTRAGCRVHATSSLQTLMRWVEEGRGDLVITDVVMPDGDGLDSLPRIAAARPALPVIVISAQNTIMTAIRATEAAAFDYLPKPFDLPDLMKRAARALEHRRGAPRAAAATPAVAPARTGDLPLIGRTPVMQALFRLVARVVNGDLPLLITGESGTGKSLLARAIHDLSERRDMPLAVARAEDLAGAEPAAALLSRAAGGTLVLEEVADFPPEAQARAVRILDHAGADGPRILATTQADLAQPGESGGLRADLLHRLAAVGLHLPPLRDRADDIPLLAGHFLGKGENPAGTTRRLSPEAGDWLRRQAWPGNVRQLENVIRRLLVTATEPVIAPAELAPLVAGQGAGAAAGEPLSASVVRHLRRYFDLHGGELPPPGVWQRVLRQVEAPLIEIALDATAGNQARCADLLGINRNTLRKKITDLDIRVTRRRKLM